MAQGPCQRIRAGFRTFYENSTGYVLRSGQKLLDGAKHVLGTRRLEHAERGALVHAGTFSRDTPAVQLDDVLDDREAEAEAAVLAGEALIGLPEPVEYKRQELGGD